MKELAHFSPTEIQNIIEPLEAIMVSIKAQNTNNREAIQEKFPTLSRTRIDKILTEPLDSDEMIEQTFTTVHFDTGHRY